MTRTDVEKALEVEESIKGIALNVQEELSEEQKSIVKRYLRKIDFRVIPVVVLLYIFSLVDRGNISAALVAGLPQHMKMSTSQQGNTVTFFYVTYLLCETPANVLLKKTTPSIWFALIGSLWSISCMCLGFINNATLFIVIRALLGAFESGFTPGVVGFLNYWYTRAEIPFRMSLFFLAVPISGIIGNPLSAFLASHRLGKFEPYQTIFIIEGAITLAISILTYFFLIDYPDKATIFTHEEKELLIRRLNTEHGMASKAKPTFKQTLNALSDWKVYVNAMIFFGYNNFAIIVGTFAPTMIKGAGFPATKSIYLASLPSAVGFFGIILSMKLVGKVKYSTLMVFYAIFPLACYV
ncbi:hypothetical protein BB560_002436, partial [Smittium megazygosporum]